MPTYAYRAVDQDGKEVHGSLDAPDTIAAKTAIEDLHLELIDLTEAMRIKQPTAQPSSDMITFAFEGKDVAGSQHRGSVQAATKREAFDNLFHSQGLRLSMLAPVGMPASIADDELAQWQAVAVPVEAATSPSPPAKPLTYEDPPVFVTIPEDTQVSSGSPEKSAPLETSNLATKYASLFSTLRLYAGWLLAWYGLFVACGYYTNVRMLPVDIPAAEGFFYSPLILSFILAIFLYLILHSIHRAMSGKFILGGALSVVGIGLFFVLRMNLV
ncbi:MAG: hypothetical protein KBD00_02785 [Candidatus Peribacteraceae bacterium]|nr:hypothetical protein [Candidatus Peribacteraceae bacterium]